MKACKAVPLLCVLLLFCASASYSRKTDSSAAQSLQSDSSTSTHEPVTLQYYTIGSPDPDLQLVNVALNNLLEKKIGIRVAYHKIDWSNYGEYMQRMINSGSTFDIAFASSTDQGDFVDNARKGTWLQLDPYLQKEGAGMYRTIDPLLWEGVRIDGKTFGVPTNKEIATPLWWGYPKELIDKYQIDISQYKTLSSLEPLLQMIQQKEPGYLPLELDKKSTNFFAQEHFEYIVGSNIPLMAQSDDPSLKIVNIFNTTYGKQILSTLHRYYEAGYINRDAALRDSSSLDKEKVFCFVASAGPYPESSWSKLRGYPVVAQQFTDSIVTTESVRGGIMVVNADTAHPQESVRFLNLINTDADVRNLLNYGIEGRHYTLTPSGQVSIISDRYTGVSYTQGNWFILRTTVDDPPDKWDLYRQFNSAAVQSKLLGFTPDTRDAGVSALITAVSRVNDKYFPALMTGTVDPETVLPMFLKELKDAGIDKLQSILQEQVNIWETSKAIPDRS